MVTKSHQKQLYATHFCGLAGPPGNHPRVVNTAGFGWREGYALNKPGATESFGCTPVADCPDIGARYGDLLHHR